MNSSCCYSSSDSPSLRFFDLHTVRHFAVKISCLGNITFPFAVPGLPNKVQTLGQRRLSAKLNDTNRKKFKNHLIHRIIYR